MLTERGIAREWIERTINEPEQMETHIDGTHHYLRKIPEHGNRWLRVVVNTSVEPNRKVTAFFDRRLRRTS